MFECPGMAEQRHTLVYHNCFLLVPTKEISIKNLDSKLKPEMNAAKHLINSREFKLMSKSYSQLIYILTLK